MRKKNWLIGSIAAAAVVICGAVGINSVNAADEDAKKSAKEEFVYEQVGSDSYSKMLKGSSTTWMANDDESVISIINKDGTIYDIDNTDGKYGEIQFSSSVSYNNYIYSQNDEKKVTLLNFDGSYAFDNGGYHDKISTFSFDDKEYAIIVNGNNTVVKAEDGTAITDKISQDDKVIQTANTFCEKYLRVVYYDGKSLTSKYYDKDFNEFDFEGKVAQEGYNFSYAKIYSGNKNYIQVNYRKTDDENNNWYYKFFDLDFKPYSSIPPYNSMSPKIEARPGAVSVSTGGGVVNETGEIFTYNLSKTEAGNYKLSDGYTAYYSGTLLGYKVILGMKTDKETKLPTYAMFDENGEKLFDNIAGPTYCRADKLVTYDGSSRKIYKVSLKSESGESEIVVDENNNLVADVIAEEVDIRDIKDENGNKITVDGLDEDAKAVIEQKFEFALKAPENVIPADTKISVSKVVAGKEYAAAKKVTEDKVDKMAVFNIDLLDSNNVKVQPNGKLEITADIPTGYDVARIAVYRLSEDGTSYTKLDSKVVDGKVVFETDHFSTYMIVEEKTTSDSADDTTKTGDVPVMALILLVSFMALAGITLFVSSKKSRV